MAKIFIYATFSGLSIAFSYEAGSETAGVGFGFSFLNQLSQAADEQIQAAVLVLSIVVTIFFIYGLARFMRQVYDQRLAGIITAVFGFLGSFLVISSQGQTLLMVIGFALLIAGVAVIILRRKR